MHERSTTGARASVAAARRGAKAGAGAAPVLLLVVLALLGALVALLVLSRSDGDPRTAAAEAPGAPGAEPTAPGAPREPAPPEADVPPEPDPRAEPAPDEVVAEDPPAPRGEGVLRGSVSVAPGGVFPPRWRLVIGPSRSLEGRERAVSRTLEFEGDVRDFRVEGLPFAGYDVRAEAEGMNGVTVPVLLVPESASPYVSLVLSPAGFVEGAVVDAEGRPVEGLPVSLEPYPGRPLRTTTDVRGVYFFENVLDGEYRLVVGRPENPLAETRRIDFRAPSMHLPDVEVDVLGRVRVLVLDRRELPVPGARVTGQGSKGGYVESKTDGRGVAWGHFLPAGRYRIYGLHDELGTGYVVLELGEREEASVEIRLEP